MYFAESQGRKHLTDVSQGQGWWSENHFRGSEVRAAEEEVGLVTREGRLGRGLGLPGPLRCKKAPLF